MDRRQEMRRWLALREREGLTFRQLARRSGINAGTLGHWAWRLRREAGTGLASKSTFVELVPSATACVDASSRVEIELRCERRVIVDAAIEPDRLARLVAALERC